MMRFLIDVNGSKNLGNLLIDKGYDVAFVRDIDAQMKDEDILALAVKERRIIVTTDKDFEQLIWQQNKPHCGVLRLENLPRNERILLLEDVLSLCIQDLLDGKIIVAMKNKFRIRQR